MEIDGIRLREADLIAAIRKVLPELLEAYRPNVSIDERLVDGSRPDILIEEASGRAFIVEVKASLPATQIRIDSAIEQLNRYAKTYMRMRSTTRPPNLVLVVPGILSTQNMDRLHRANIRVIDGPTLKSANVSSDILHAFHMQGGGSDRPAPTDPGRHLLRQLTRILPGRVEWSLYQKTVRDLLTLALCPPLEQPLHESASANGVNRRDIVFPNYAPHGFWHYMQQTYSAHYIVVDAKNYSGKVKKESILQLANYLSVHGAGLFGVIVTRTSGDRGAEATRREQWVIGQKLIIILNDADLEQMIDLRKPGGDPGLVIRQKIKDFRLSF